MNAQRPALVFLNGIGDHFINLPAIRAAAALYPNRLRIICRAGARQLFSDLPVASVHELKWGLDQRDRVLESDEALGALERCDLLLSLNPWHTDSVDRMLQIIKPRHSVGFFSAFSTHVPLNFAKHSAELAFDISRSLGNSLPIEHFSAPPALPPNSNWAAEEIRKLLPKGSKILAVHPETLEEKMWKLDRFRSFLNQFLDRNREFFALVVGLNDLSLDEGRHKERIISCHGLPFFTSAALVASSDLFVGVNSCMLHVADIFRVPGVGLFGPTNPNEFGFRLTDLRHVWSDSGSTADIEAAEVAETVVELLRARKVQLSFA